MGTAMGVKSDAWDHLAVVDRALAVDYLMRVHRGAALLDLRRPGWAAKVALDRLAMDSCTECILGQLYGQYLHGRRKLGLGNWSASADRGFALSPDDGVALGTDEGQKPIRFAALGALWRREVRSRLAGEGVAIG